MATVTSVEDGFDEGGTTLPTTGALVIGSPIIMSTRHATKGRVDAKLRSDISNGTFPLETGFGDQGGMMLISIELGRGGEETKDEADGEGEESNEEGDEPEIGGERGGLEGGTTVGDNEILASEDKELDTKEEPVPKDATEDIVRIINLTAVDLIEDLEHDKGIEDEGPEEEIIGGGGLGI